LELTTSQWIDLDQALTDAYDKDTFGRMLLQRCNRRLDSIIVPENVSFPTIVDRVMGEARDTGWLPQLIRGSLAFVPGNPLIQQFIINYPEFDPTIPPPPVADPYNACLLRAKRVFINRRGLRQALKELGTPDGPRVLVVTGERATGKTYTHEMISHLASRIQGHRPPVYVDLDVYQYKPVELAEAIGHRMGRPDIDTIPKQYDDQSPRWNEKLCDWLVGGVTRDQPNIWWFVLDGFRKKTALPEMVDFIEKLAVLVERSVTRLRLVLLNYTQLLPDNIDSVVGRDRIEPIGRSDLESFFQQISRERAQPYDDEELRNVIDEILTQVEDKVTRVADGNERRLEYINAAVLKTVQERNIFQ
jgi:Effector-associated domain 1